MQSHNYQWAKSDKWQLFRLLVRIAANVCARRMCGWVIGKSYTKFKQLHFKWTDLDLNLALMQRRTQLHNDDNRQLTSSRHFYNHHSSGLWAIHITAACALVYSISEWRRWWRTYATTILFIDIYSLQCTLHIRLYISLSCYFRTKLWMAHLTAPAAKMIRCDRSNTKRRHRCVCVCECVYCLR